MLERRVSSICEDAFDREGLRWAAGVVDAEANALAEAVRERPDDVDVLLLVSPSGQLAVSAGPIDAGEIVDELTAEFGGGGGGSPDVVQAGGLDADGEAVIAFFDA